MVCEIGDEGVGAVIEVVCLWSVVLVIYEVGGEGLGWGSRCDSGQ